MRNQLPPDLRAGLERMTRGHAARPLSARSRDISTAYRSGQTSRQAIGGLEDALVYGLARMPATYAAALAALEAAAIALPDFTPADLIDLGAGTGSASWAAVNVWPMLQSVTLVDRHPAFADLAAGLCATADHAALSGVRAAVLDLGDAGRTFGPADLVIASYVLAELTPEAADDLTRRAWAAAEGVLALVEPGTPEGFRRIIRARRILIDGGAQIAAPCPTHCPCPLTGPDWCHFKTRLPRMRAHRQVKGAEVPFEDEPFSYLIAARPAGVVPASQRILAAPVVGKAGTSLKLCTQSGLREVHIPRRDRNQFAKTRRMTWGDGLPAEDQV